MKKNNVGRPKAEIDWDTLEGLISIFCTGEECAAVLDIDYDTLNKAIIREKNMNFTEYFKLKSPRGKASLRRRQFEMAKTNPALCIWLGKQYLGQRDNAQDEGRELPTVVINTYGENSMGLETKSVQSVPRW